MTTDLRIALAHGGTFLVAAGFQYGIFAVLVLDAKHGLLEFFLLFQLLGVGEKVHLIDALVRRDLVGVDSNAPHRQRRVGDALKQLCAFVDEMSFSPPPSLRDTSPMAGATQRRSFKYLR